MKMKKLIALLLAGVLVVSLAACGSSSSDDTSDDASADTSAEATEDTSSSDETYEVLFVARASADTFAAWLTSEMQSTADEYDNINLTYVSGEADDDTENSLLEQAITVGYDLVIVQSNNNAAQAPYVQMVSEAGIPVITTNPTTHQSDLDGSDDDSVMEGTGTVDADPVEQASVSATCAVDEIPENANVIVLNGPSGNYHAEKRREAWEDVFFSVRDDVTIIGEDYANWNSDEAYELMSDWVNKGVHIDAIISTNDNMAAGAIEAIRGNSEYFDDDGNPNFLAYGVDGTAQGCLLVQEGVLTSTALQDAAEIADLCLYYANEVLQGNMDITEVNDYVSAPEINADNVDEYIQVYIDNGEITSDGELAEE